METTLNQSHNYLDGARWGSSNQLSIALGQETLLNWFEVLKHTNMMLVNQKACDDKNWWKGTAWNYPV